jgi:hypothetical protein
METLLSRESVLILPLLPRQTLNSLRVTDPSSCPLLFDNGVDLEQEHLETVVARVMIHVHCIK